jgi:hypothetical protein
MGAEMDGGNPDAYKLVHRVNNCTIFLTLPRIYYSI